MVPDKGYNAPACSETEEEIPIWPIHTLTSIYWKPAVCAKSFPDSSVGKESAHNAGDPSSIPGLGRSAGEGIGYPLQYSWASLVARLVKNVCNAGDLGSIPGLGRSPGEGKGYPLQYSGLENSMERIVHGVAKTRTRLSNFHLLRYNSHAIQFILLLPLLFFSC